MLLLVTYIGLHIINIQFIKSIIFNFLLNLNHTYFNMISLTCFNFIILNLFLIHLARSGFLISVRLNSDSFQKELIAKRWRISEYFIQMKILYQKF